MKLACVVALCACRTPNSPAQPIAPLPPDPGSGSAKTEPVAFPAFPVIDDVPASHPSGPPIAIPAYVPRLGDLEHQVETTTFEQHYTHGSDTRYQLTETTFDLHVKTL